MRTVASPCPRFRPSFSTEVSWYCREAVILGMSHSWLEHPARPTVARNSVYTFKYEAMVITLQYIRALLGFDLHCELAFHVG